MRILILTHLMSSRTALRGTFLNRDLNGCSCTVYVRLTNDTLLPLVTEPSETMAPSLKSFTSVGDNVTVTLSGVFPDMMNYF